jgi:hypothetical protein
MKSVVILIIATALCGCIASTQIRPELSPKTSYNLLGATVYSPSTPGWSSGPSNIYGVSFGKQYGTPLDTAVANTTIFKVEGFDSDSDFLMHIAEQRERQDDKNRFKILRINNEQVTYKETSCLKYNNVSEDHHNSGIDSKDFQYLKTKGYVCRHPFNIDIAFQMEISHRSNEKEFPEELLTVGKEFFSNIQFNDNGFK